MCGGHVRLSTALLTICSNLASNLPCMGQNVRCDILTWEVDDSWAPLCVKGSIRHINAHMSHFLNLLYIANQFTCTRIHHHIIKFACTSVNFRVGTFVPCRLAANSLAQYIVLSWTTANLMATSPVSGGGAVQVNDTVLLSARLVWVMPLKS